ncbi:MAG: hypothetical protein ACI87O_001496 [Planctomycetota bacterium]|jgi:hypothetical protein
MGIPCRPKACQSPRTRYPAPLMDRPRDRNTPPQPSERDRGTQDPSPEAIGFPIPLDLGKRLHVTGREFLADFLGAEVQKRPDNLPALTALSQNLAQLDRRLQGLAVDEQLALLDPTSPIIHYNLACSQALNEDFPAALTSLRKAVTLGFADASFMAGDPDLENLHPLQTFRSLVEELGQRQPTQPE